MLDQISKVYPNGKGIHDFSLTANKGETIAVVGPNGSGKTTLFKILAGINRVDSGVCLFNETIISDDFLKSKIGYLPDEPFLFDQLNPLEFLNFVQSMKGVDCSVNINFLLEKLGLWANRYDRIKTFSYGMKKKVVYIATVMNHPDILILDELTNGFDTKSLIVIKNQLNEFKNTGCIIFISSHILEFIANIADVFIFIYDGVILKTTRERSMIEKIYTELYMK